MRKLTSLKFFADDNHCKAKAMSEFIAMEARFDSLDECCRIKFPQGVSDCCKAGEGDCVLSGKSRFIPVSIFFQQKIPEYNCVSSILLPRMFAELARPNLLHQR